MTHDSYMRNTPKSVDSNQRCVFDGIDFKTTHVFGYEQIPGEMLLRLYCLMNHALKMRKNYER